MADVAIVGTGAMGLAAAYHALKAGHSVTVFEVDDRPGGMAAHFDFGGLSLERFYHFICKADRPTFELLSELGLADAMRWRETSMGFFYKGALYPWSDPVSLLRFPHLGLLTKLRYGLMAFTATKRSNWRRLDRVNAKDWLIRWVGEEGWTVLWEKLFTLKFFEHADNLSAAWIWTRIKRVGTSRKNMLQEEFGYIEGGSETLIKRLVQRIGAMGGTIRLSTAVDEVVIEDGRATGVIVKGERRDYDHVISTIPLPYVRTMIPGLPDEVKHKLAAQKNIGVVCVVHKLARSISKNFWLNINDDRIDVPGIIEFSNLRPMGEDHIVYVPFYLPDTNPKWSWSTERFIAESFGYLKTLNPDLRDGDRRDSRVGRIRYAQPICPPGFLDTLPPINAGIDGLQVADTSYYYPEDRGIAESVRLGREMAANIG